MDIYHLAEVFWLQVTITIARTKDHIVLWPKEQYTICQTNQNSYKLRATGIQCKISTTKNDNHISYKNLATKTQMSTLTICDTIWIISNFIRTMKQFVQEWHKKLQQFKYTSKCHIYIQILINSPKG